MIECLPGEALNSVPRTMYLSYQSNFREYFVKQYNYLIFILEIYLHFDKNAKSLISIERLI
jgi:hypothetical protein